MRLFSKQLTESRCFKDRSRKHARAPWQELSTCGYYCHNVYVKREYRFEIIHFGLFKKILKKLSKRQKVSRIFNNKNVWVFWKPNYPLTKKSKNSRMGKGKGPFLRWTFRVGAQFKIFTIKEVINRWRVSAALRKLNLKFPQIFYAASSFKKL